MANSITFDSVDLDDYDLIITRYDLHVAQIAEYTQIRDKSYSWGNWIPPKDIVLGISVTGTTRALLDAKLDSIKLALNKRTDETLALDIQTDRYWMARFRGFPGGYLNNTTWIGQILFTCADPWAYDVTETDNNYLINADPDTNVETTGGTARIEPVYTLTAGENLVAVTVKLENTTTEEELVWEGSLANTEELVIDVVRWIVEKEGVADMADVSGQFPHLLGGQANSIVVTGFSTTGTLDIVYRNRYM